MSLWEGTPFFSETKKELLLQFNWRDSKNDDSKNCWGTCRRHHIHVHPRLQCKNRVESVSTVWSAYILKVSKSENHRTRFPAVQHSISFEYSRINTRGNMLGHKHRNTNCSMKHVTGMSANKSKLAIKLDTLQCVGSPHPKCIITISLTCKTQCKLGQSSKGTAVQVNKSCEGWSTWKCTTKVEIRQGCKNYTIFFK